MIKSGVVMKVEKSAAIIMSPTGEFHRIGFKGEKPLVGQELQGHILKKNTYYRSLIAAAIIVFIILSGVLFNQATEPYAVVRININPSIELKANKKGEIVSFSGLNKDGDKILGEINIKGKNLGEALKLIVAQAEKDNFINPQYIAKGNKIAVSIASKGTKEFSLTSFEQYIKDKGLSAEISDGSSQEKIESPKADTPPKNIVVPESKSEDNKRQELPQEKDKAPKSSNDLIPSKAKEKENQNNSSKPETSNNSSVHQNDNSNGVPQLEDNKSDGNKDSNNNGKTNDQTNSKDNKGKEEQGKNKK